MRGSHFKKWITRVTFARHGEYMKMLFALAGVGVVGALLSRCLCSVDPHVLIVPLSSKPRVAGRKI
jgi:hypothetical protein